ncbi:MAG: Rid family detoxifying hydrolase [Proteobacteria bacterium]|nr:Rid family detoxifying hydrolase [Pseudomonadota bacterium]MBU4385059.1 Rid family detoxifying hydrolase [Pseudomonadota bacterium]MBU4605021.1 Rid family detoxifying hydrolase [Pseudomonadota bacterium]MCG2763181.1 Rid family detoxifying hydrolase [Desulfarculaceae bacterium]
MSKSKTVTADNAPAAVGPYSHACWAGDLLFVSGQLGLEPATGALAEGGVEAQAKQAMNNFAAVLKAAGLDWSQVVKTTIFLQDMADFPTVNKIYAQFFSAEEGYPARACVQVAKLPLGGLVEVEGVVNAAR